MSQRRRSPFSLLELSSTCIVKSCARKSGLREVASALTSQLPRPLLQRVCAKVALDIGDKHWLYGHSQAADHPFWIINNYDLSFCRLKWYTFEEAAYRTRICNEEIDRFIVME